MKSFKILLTLLALGYATGILAQENRTPAESFMLKGEVIDADTDSPISRVNVEIVGGDYTTTNKAGEFTIAAKMNDRLVVKSDAFETVYITIKDRQRITVKAVKAADDIEAESLPSKNEVASRRNRDMFKVYIDSAKYFLKRDAKKSIEFVTKSLESVRGKAASNLENAIAFETLGDINLYWEQPDLALDNYKRSVASSPRIDARIKLAVAFIKNSNYQEGIDAYYALLKEKLSNYQRVEVYEGLGDAYLATGDSEESATNYQEALTIAAQHRITPKVADLNSKLGSSLAQSGAVEEAEEYYGNSLSLSKKVNKKRAVEEKNKVADFYNQTQNFDKEIELRQEALSEIDQLEDATSLENANSPLTPQRQNYKIANAFVAQDKYQEAIPYLERSINEAGAKEDLLVEKDATRKLSEVYKDLGDFGRAADTYERYVDVVDELYIKKEQELSQASRFNREIALKQNRITSLENERALNESRYQLAFENQELIEKNNTVQKWIIGSLIALTLLFLFSAYSQRKNVKQQKYANNLLALKSLRTQMNPHFIFNALNSVNSFIASNDERAANKYLSDFSKLMRSVLENSEEDFIPLAKEIELLQLYVKLEHFRFQDKFNYEIIVDESIKLDEFVIPPMLLQPYVENAVWHGLRYKEDKGHLEIEFKQITSEVVEISILDDGIGRKKSKELKTENQKKQKSKGMGNIQKRISILNTMYKDKVDVSVENAFENEEGTKVILTLKKD